MKEVNHIVPKGWKPISIGTCISERRKSSIKVDDAANYGQYPFFTSGDNVLQHTSPLVSGENIFLATGGVANVKYYCGEAAFSTDTYTVTTKEGIDTKYLYYHLLYLREYINTNFFQGSGLKHLKKKDLKDYVITVPSSIVEQRCIADALSQIDGAIEKTDALIGKYESIKKGLMSDLLSCGIDVSGRIRSMASHQFKESPLGLIPKEWEVVEMSSIMTAIDAQPDHRTPPDADDGVPYVGIGDVDESGHLIADKCRIVGKYVLEKQKSILTVENGDIIFGKIGTIGEPKRLPMLRGGYAISANVIVIKPKEDAAYLYYTLKSDYVKKEVDLSIHSTSQPAFGMEKIRALLVKKPLKTEQESISKILQEVDSYIDDLHTEKAKLSSMAAGLLADLITGRVRVKYNEL